MIELVVEPERTGLAGRTLKELPTPALVLDKDRMDRNLARLSSLMSGHAVMLRPHLKTAKSIDVARRIHRNASGPIAVSTLAEAEYFAREGGYSDITYAVGLDPMKSDRVLKLCALGIDLKVTIDTPEQAMVLGQIAAGAEAKPAVLIEIDCDGHRGGLVPNDPAIIDLAKLIDGAGLELSGVLTHAGDSYNLQSPNALADAAENERASAVRAAGALRSAGFACPVVSVGSTPTAHFARDLTGVTEVRAGVYMFFDLVMHGVGVCEIDDIAVSVLATVIGTKPEKGWTLVDSGWMALSRDCGTSNQLVDQGYGLVGNLEGAPYADLVVDLANQEH